MFLFHYLSALAFAAVPYGGVTTFAYASGYCPIVAEGEAREAGIEFEGISLIDCGVKYAPTVALYTAGIVYVLVGMSYFASDEEKRSMLELLAAFDPPDDEREKRELIKLFDEYGVAHDWELADDIEKPRPHRGNR